MRSKKSLKNIIVGIISLIITTFLGFILFKIFIQNIGVEKNGLNSLFSNILAILSISELGIAGAINYNLYKPILEEDYDKISSIMQFYKKCYRVIGIVIISLALIMSLFIEKFVTDTTLEPLYIKICFLIYSLNAASTYFLAYYRNLFYGYQVVYITTYIDSTIRIIKSVIQIISIILFKSFVLYLILNVFFDFLGNVIIHIYAKKKFKNIDLKTNKRDKLFERKVFKDVKSLSIIQVTNALINFTDSLLISKFVGIIQTGLYANYKMIINQLTNFINTIFNGVGASIGNLLAENKENKIESTLYNLELLCFLLGLIVSCGIFSLMQPFITLWLGDKYLISNSIVIILAINIYVYIQRQVITYFLRTGGHHDKMIFSSILEAILNLMISIFLVFKYKIFGILLGTFISSLYGYIKNSKILYKIYNINYRIFALKETFMFIFNVFIGTILFMLSNLIKTDLLLNFIFNIIIYVFVIFFTIIMLIYFNKNFIFFKNQINVLLSKIIRKKC